MRRLGAILLLCLLTLAGDKVYAVSTPTGGIVKVLPLFLDTNNVVATSPSLFDRDAYQFYLLQHTNAVSGMRFDVLWKAHKARGLSLTVRMELRGVGPAGLPRETMLEQSVTPKLFRHWVSLTLNGPAYRNFGTLAAWRATIWNGNQLLGEQKSFLW